MAVAEKIKLPGESTTSPSFASPQIATAADVRQSQQVTGGMPAPAAPKATVTSATPMSQSTPSQPGGSGTSTLIPKAPSPTVTSVPTVPTSTGAPPGVPLTSATAAPMTSPQTPNGQTPPPTVPPPPTVGLAPTMGSIQGKNAAEDDYLQAKNQYEQELYNAALKYNGGPTSELEVNKRNAETGLRSATASRGAAGTIDSSLYGEDKSKLSTDLAVGDQQAFNTYQQSLATAQDAMNKAQIAFTRATEQEKKEITEAAERRSEREKLEAAANPPAPAPAPGAPPANAPVIVGETPQPSSPGGPVSIPGAPVIVKETQQPSAPPNSHFPKTNPSNGQHYREYKDKGHTVHEYEDGRKVVV